MDNQNEDSSKRILSTDDLIVSYSPLTVMVFLALLIILSILLSKGIIFPLEAWYGLTVEEALRELTRANSRGLRDFIRLALATNHLFIFILPSVIVALFFYKKNWKSFLLLNFSPKEIQSRNVLFGVLLIIAAFPIAQFTLWLNQQLPLPEWAKTIEESTNALLLNLLEVASPFELFLNLLVVAIIPALGEELLFRGIIQRSFEKWFKRPHLAIWLAAIIFSAFHVQFEGFLPRMLLGAVLGYLFYFSGSLWIAIITHLVYNAIQVIAVYLYANKMSTVDIEQIDKTPFGLIIISIIFVSVIGYYFIQFNQKAEKLTG